MNKVTAFLLSAISLSACNSVYLKPNTLDASQVFYVGSGGNLMQLGSKEHMEERGYKLTVGHKRTSVKTTYSTSENVDSIISNADIGKARYIVDISETTNKFRPFWCSLNGFWWTRFNMSIADNVTGQELLHWAGRGCVNSSVRKLDKILDKLEISEN